jgi:starch phosphorylase
MDIKLRFLITGLTSIHGSFQDMMLLWMCVSPHCPQLRHANHQ